MRLWALKSNCFIFLSHAACDVPGIHRLLPQPWREWEFFENIYKLSGVPVVTVQLRFNGWVTEMQDLEASRYFDWQGRISCVRQF